MKRLTALLLALAAERHLAVALSSGASSSAVKRFMDASRRCCFCCDALCCGWIGWALSRPAQSPRVPAQRTCARDRSRRLRIAGQRAQLGPAARPRPFPARRRGPRYSSAARAFCSTSRIETPVVRRSAMIRKISRTISGAPGPRLGSSSISNLGWAISARPSASIWRSPPERVLAAWRRRSLAGAGTSRTPRRGSRMVRGPLSMQPAREGAQRRLSRSTCRTEQFAAFRHQAQAAARPGLVHAVEALQRSRLGRSRRRSASAGPSGRAATSSCPRRSGR